MLIPIGVVTAIVAATPARGQFRIIPRERLDSLAHPAMANGAHAMRFDRIRIETGPIGEDDGPKSYDFEWQNVGNKPLVITRVTTTCGCAAPSWDKQPVKPGEKARITVTYHPKGHPGSFVRKIFLFTQLAENAPRPFSNSQVRSFLRPAHPTPIPMPGAICCSNRRRSASTEIDSRPRASNV